MTTSALIMMILVQLTVTSITAYFFGKVLKAPKRSEPDTFTDEQ
ncbi:hypothetical protein BH23BAC1_BH23BAC1_06350 [soil metagenome]